MSTRTVPPGIVVVPSIIAVRALSTDASDAAPPPVSSLRVWALALWLCFAPIIT